MPVSSVSGLYASGIALPIVGTGAGGFGLEEGAAYVDGMVRIAVGSGQSHNPFQDIGFDERFIFENADDPALRAGISGRVRRNMKLLDDENLARFVRIDFDDSFNDNGDLILRIDYINLETREPGTVSMAVSESGDFSPFGGGS
jgi:hypothetical protein